MEHISNYDFIKLLFQLCHGGNWMPPQKWYSIKLFIVTIQCGVQWKEKLSGNS